MNSSSNSTDVEVPDYNNFAFPYMARFIFYLLLDIPAIICSLTILIVFLTDRQCRNGLHNHAIIALVFIILISELFDIPIYIDQLRIGASWSKPPIFCYIWRYIDSSCFAATPLLLAWLSIERHVIIFHRNTLNSRRNQILFHYIPPIFTIIYVFIFYFIAVIHPPCENEFDAVCGGVCFFYVPWLSLWDLIGHNIIPTFLIIVFSIGMLFRTIRQRRRFRQPVQWRKLRRMTIQLILISSLFLVFCLPATICFSLLPFLIFNTDTLFNFLPYAAYFSYFPQLLLPFVCFISIPELLTKFQRLIHIYQQRRMIAPAQNRRLTRRTNLQ